MKLITEILNEENKALKQATHNDAITNDTWIDARSRGPRGLAILQPPKVAPSTHGIPTTHEIPVARQYSLPTANRYDALSNRQKSWELSDSILPTNFEDSTKLMPGKTNEHAKGLRRMKSSAVNQHKRTVVHQRNKHNLQELSANEDRSCYIPTIVNGETKVTYTTVSVPKYSDSTKSLIHKLRETFNVHNKEKVSHSKKHRIILIGDSNIKGYASNLKSLLSNNDDLYSITKPGSKTSELKESAKEKVSQLCHDDVMIICSGTNDYELNNFDQTFLNIRNFVMNNDHTNIMLMNIPYQYDIPNSISANMNIAALNRKLQKLVKVLLHMSFLKTDEDRKL